MKLIEPILTEPLGAWTYIRRTVSVLSQPPADADGLLTGTPQKTSLSDRGSPATRDEFQRNIVYGV